MSRVPRYIIHTIRVALPIAVIIGALGGGAYAEWTAQQTPQLTPFTTVTVPHTVSEVPAGNSSTPARSTSTSSSSTSGASSSTTLPSAPRGGAESLTPQTAQPAPVQTSGTPTVLSRADYSSTNWAGYLSAVSGASYTSVNGSWTVPSPTGQAGTVSADAAWVGIGGVTTNDLIQVGTENQVSPDGTVLTAAFYETLPQAATVIPSMTVNPGDTVVASVNETSPDVFTVSITDTTNGSSFSTSVNYASSHSSAEWIEEDPSYTSQQLVPFDQFGSINFSGATTTMNGVAQSLVNASPRSISLQSSSRYGSPAAAMPTSIGPSGSSFSVVQQ